MLRKAGYVVLSFLSFSGSLCMESRGTSFSSKVGGNTVEIHNATVEDKFRVAQGHSSTKSPQNYNNFEEKILYAGNYEQLSSDSKDVLVRFGDSGDVTINSIDDAVERLNIIVSGTGSFLVKNGRKIQFLRIEQRGTGVLDVGTITANRVEVAQSAGMVICNGGNADVVLNVSGGQCRYLGNNLKSLNLKSSGGGRFLQLDSTQYFNQRTSQPKKLKDYLIVGGVCVLRVGILSWIGYKVFTNGLFSRN